MCENFFVFLICSHYDRSSVSFSLGQTSSSNLCIGEETCALEVQVQQPNAHVSVSATVPFLIFSGQFTLLINHITRILCIKLNTEALILIHLGLGNRRIFMQF